VLLQAERADRFLAMKQHTAGEHARERDLRQTLEAAVRKIHGIAGNTTAEKSELEDFEGAMEEIFQVILNLDLGLE